MNIEFNDFGLEWDHGDGVKHKADYDDLIAAYESKWIPAKEQDPPKDGTYPCTLSDGEIYYVFGQYFSNGWFWQIDRWIKINLEVEGLKPEVIAWMPLPEPWKGE